MIIMIPVFVWCGVNTRHNAHDYTLGSGTAARCLGWP